jgi:hypothetical protein
MPAKKFLRLTAGRPAEVAGVVVSAGAANAGDIPALGDDGLLDPSVVPAVAGTVAWWGRITNSTPIAPSSGTTLTLDRMHYLPAGSFPIPTPVGNAGKVIVARAASWTPGVSGGISILDAGAGVTIGGQARYFYLVMDQRVALVSDGAQWIAFDVYRPPRVLLSALAGQGQALTSLVTNINWSAIPANGFDLTGGLSTNNWTIPYNGWYRYNLHAEVQNSNAYPIVYLYNYSSGTPIRSGTQSLYGNGPSALSGWLFKSIAGETISARVQGNVAMTLQTAWFNIEYIRGDF